MFTQIFLVINELYDLILIILKLLLVLIFAWFNEVATFTSVCANGSPPLGRSSVRFQFRVVLVNEGWLLLFAAFRKILEHLFILVFQHFYHLIQFVCARFELVGSSCFLLLVLNLYFKYLFCQRGFLYVRFRFFLFVTKIAYQVIKPFNQYIFKLVLWFPIDPTMILNRSTLILRFDFVFNLNANALFREALFLQVTISMILAIRCHFNSRIVNCLDFILWENRGVHPLMVIMRRLRRLAFLKWIH